jgi:hypothetical protein
MNTYYELIKHIKITFEEDERIKTVVTGDWEQWKRDVFLLAHIDVVDAPYISELNTSTIRFNIDISVVDIRDVNKQDVKDKFWHNDTRHDSWNDTLSVLNLARNKILRDHLRNDITLVTATSAQRITYAYMNGLDGWQQTWTIDVPDTFTAIC